MAATLFSRENMQEVADILGRHYELVSMLYRLLGAKVGKRVFWPGQQPIFTGEFDLLEIGDDVGKSRDISHRKFHAGQNVFSRECLFCIP
jgi:hypothetical protein